MARIKTVTYRPGELQRRERGLAETTCIEQLVDPTLKAYGRLARYWIEYVILFSLKKGY
jgi:hypothetical protein